jgi:hypothetical protein
MGGACRTHGRDKKCIAYTILVGNPEGERTFERHRHRWEYIKLVPRHIGCQDVDYIQLAPNRVQRRDLVNIVAQKEDN